MNRKIKVNQFPILLKEVVLKQLKLGASFFVFT